MPPAPNPPEIRRPPLGSSLGTGKIHSESILPRLRALARSEWRRPHPGAYMHDSASGIQAATDPMGSNPTSPSASFGKPQQPVGSWPKYNPSLRSTKAGPHVLLKASSFINFGGAALSPSPGAPWALRPSDRRRHSPTAWVYCGSPSQGASCPPRFIQPRSDAPSRESTNRLSGTFP